MLLTIHVAFGSVDHFLLWFVSMHFPYSAILPFPVITILSPLFCLITSWCTSHTVFLTEKVFFYTHSLALWIYSEGGSPRPPFVFNAACNRVLTVFSWCCRWCGAMKGVSSTQRMHRQWFEAVILRISLSCRLLLSTKLNSTELLTPRTNALGRWLVLLHKSMKSTNSSSPLFADSVSFLTESWTCLSDLDRPLRKSELDR